MPSEAARRSVITARESDMGMEQHGAAGSSSGYHVLSVLLLQRFPAGLGQKKAALEEFVVVLASLASPSYTF